MEAHAPPAARPRAKARAGARAKGVGRDAGRDAAGRREIRARRWSERLRGEALDKPR